MTRMFLIESEWNAVALEEVTLSPDNGDCSYAGRYSEEFAEFKVN